MCMKGAWEAFTLAPSDKYCSESFFLMLCYKGKRLSGKSIGVLVPISLRTKTYRPPLSNATDTPLSAVIRGPERAVES